MRTLSPDRRGARVAVMGTGLTMADCIATLSRLGHRADYRLSRRGLLSQGNTGSRGVPASN